MKCCEIFNLESGTCFCHFPPTEFSVKLSINGYIIEKKSLLTGL